ncbi:MAG: hydantoinase/oxoprolinase family protein [Alphaproteobacteria bacterium]|nr:hydantoinase/oxoprolinase family protein [Alphaproteobacteria bacterium]MCB9930223.1 hydantoinase/oxoprolinase family protein [Alphaproteobacteria bacterium]
MTTDPARLAVDIGGTFTDVVLEHGSRQFTTKVLTTPDAPERGVLEGVARAMTEAGLAPPQVGLLIHGTTLATNALIERKGAKTALVTTEGHRDAVEMALENRFEQYDINIDRPAPLVPRYLRWPVAERLNVQGQPLLPLDEASVAALFPLIEKHAIEALAVGLLHAYANPAHEERVRDRIAARFPDLAISLSSEVAPEIREYERQSTTCANAYVQPKMARYLQALDAELQAQGFRCPFLLMTSGGGLTDLATAVKFPIRLVESGPAGGAILAARIAEELGLDRVVSYDMGGTTAKICLIDDYQPLATRTFEVARAYRNLKGSGLPVKIPAIEMVEIGAGGGSIASVDALGRVAVGPESAGSQPGPACYDQGGSRAAVTDADLVLGKIDPAAFAGGSVKLAPEKAGEALERTIGRPLGMDAPLAAFAVAEIVDENMANAARVHAVEWGKDIAARAMIAFGGAAPLHAARLAEKLNLSHVIVPAGAGVGSAVGFLRAPISYEVVRSRYMRLDQFDAAAANELLGTMLAEATAIVRLGAPEADLTETRMAFMRYVGQGHEITVPLPARALEAGDAATLRAAFEDAYRALYGQTVPGQEPEILSWTLTVASPAVSSQVSEAVAGGGEAGEPVGTRRLFDSNAQAFVEAAVWRRESLGDGEAKGPALIVEDQTTTVVPDGFTARVGQGGALVLTRE